MSSGSDWYREDAVLLRTVQISGWTAPIEPSIPGFADWQELGRGGQGVVYSATQLSTHRRVAVKILMGGPIASRAQFRRFEREIDLIAGFQHPNIVRLYDRGVTDQGQPYYVMELIDGCNLEAHLGLRRPAARRLFEAPRDRIVPPDARAPAEPPPVRETLGLLAKVCEAITYAHRHGVVHRDLKPGNILVDGAGEPHVLDFGLARVVRPDAYSSSATMSQTGDFIGTLPWSSPEQAEGAPDLIDARSDVYALGVILFQVLTGTLPYAMSTLCEALENIRNADPPRPSTVRRGLSGEIDAIVLKCLAKQPQYRYRDAGELAGDLRNYLAGEPLLARAESLLARMRRGLRRYRPAASLVGLLLVCGAGATALAWAWRLFGFAGDGAAGTAEAGFQQSMVRLRDGPTVALSSFAGLGDRINVPTNLALGYERPTSASLQQGQSLDVAGYLTIGTGTSARLDVRDGASVSCWNARIADLEDGDGLVTIRGQGTRWKAQELTSSDGWFMLGGRSAKLQILDGAVVEDCRGHIAWGIRSVGEALVEGPGSAWRHRFFLEVGRSGRAELLIQNGGLVSSLQAWLARAPESEGSVVVAGVGSQWINAGSLYVGGNPESPGGRAHFLIEDGGTVVVCHALRVWGPGAVNLQGGWLAAAEIDQSQGGQLDFTSGVLETESFDGDLVNQGGTLVGGASSRAVVIAGDYQQKAGTLALTLRGADSPDAPRLLVGGTAKLGGRLILDCATDFQPLPNEERVILAANALDGEFEHPEGRIDFIGGGSCAVIYTAAEVILTDFDAPRPRDDSAPQTPLCRECAELNPDAPFPVHLAENTTGDSDLTFLGPPDNIGCALRDRSVVYDFGALSVLDGEGPDFNVYEWFFGGPHSRDVDVQASADGVSYASLTSTEGPCDRILGDEAHAAPGNIRAYDLAVTGLSAVRYVRIQGLLDAGSGHRGAFSLDAVGAIHYEAANRGAAPD